MLVSGCHPKLLDLLPYHKQRSSGHLLVYFAIHLTDQSLYYFVTRLSAATVESDPEFVVQVLVAHLDIAEKDQWLGSPQKP